MYRKNHLVVSNCIDRNELFISYRCTRGTVHPCTDRTPRFSGGSQGTYLPTARERSETPMSGNDGKSSGEPVNYENESSRVTTSYVPSEFGG